MYDYRWISKAMSCATIVKFSYCIPFAVLYFPTASELKILKYHYLKVIFLRKMKQWKLVKIWKYNSKSVKIYTADFFYKEMI